MSNETTTAVVQNVRLSYVNVFKPYSNSPELAPKYSSTILLPKSDLVSKQSLDAAIQAATQKGLNEKWNGIMPPVVANPIKDGDGVKQDGTPFGDECKGCWVFTASSNADRQPQIVDRNVQPILDQSQIYSGVYANVAINVFPYLHSGKKGVGFGLTHIQKVRDGEVLGGAPVSADKVFNALGGAQANNPFPNPQQYQQPMQQQPVQQYQQPMQQPVQQYQQPMQQQPVQQNTFGVDPITGLPL